MTPLLDHWLGETEIDNRIRELRAGVLQHTEQVHQVLIDVEDDRFSHADRVGLALATVREIDDPILISWFTALAEDAGPARNSVVDGWLSLIRTMTHRPRLVDADMINSLVRQQGADRVVVVSQLVSYLAYLSRLVAALTVERNRTSAGTASVDATPDSGMPTITMRPRRWEPYLEPIEDRELSTPEREAFAATSKGAEKQPYYRVLARDPGSLRERSSMYNLIMYDDGGLEFADREFAALWTSLRNGCPYCASVHVRRLQTHTDRATAETALAVGQQQADHDQLSERQRTAAAVAEALTDRRTGQLAAAINRARTQGWDKIEIFDLVAVVAVFGWANRLMLALGGSRES